MTPASAEETIEEPNRQDVREQGVQGMQKDGQKNRVLENVVYDRGFDRFGEVRGLSKKVISPGNQMLLALDVDTEGSTVEVIKIHLHRIVLTLLLFVFMQMLGVLDQVEEAAEILQQLWFLVKMNARLEGGSSKYSFGFASRKLDYVSYLRQLVLCFPGTAYSFVFNILLCYTPSGMKSFQDSIPPDCLPKSLGMVLRLNENLVPPPPPIPQPYLDADKKIVVPGQKEVSSVLVLRSEYFTQQRAYIAAERVRMLSELGRMVTWSCLTGAIHFVDIYERFGLLWNDEKSDIESQLDLIGCTILNELSAFINSCRKNELDSVDNMVPRVTLVEVSSGTRHTLKDPFHDEQSMIPPSGSIGPYEERREMLVYLSDYRLKEESLIDLTLRTIANPETLDSNLQDYFPPTPDLIIIPDIRNRKNVILDGFVSTSRDGDDAKSSLLYAKNKRFGFKFFTRSLLYYSATNRDSSFKLDFNYSTNTSNRSLYELVSQTPSHYWSKLTSCLPQFNLFKWKSGMGQQESSANYIPPPDDSTGNQQ